MAEVGFVGQERKQFGISVSAEVARYHAVACLFGNPLAEYEGKRNLEAYRREFLMDEAVALPQTYHFIRGELYSQPKDHPLLILKTRLMIESVVAPHW